MSAVPLPIDKSLYTNRKLLQLIVPLVIEQMLFLSVGTIDTVMIASLGEDAVSGVSLGDMINCVVACLFAALGTGGAVVVSQHLGGKRFLQARESASHLFYMSLAIGAFFTMPMFCLRGWLLRLLFGDVSAGAMTNAMVYFGITVFTYPVMAGYTACTALFRSMNRSNVCMYISFVMNVMNLIGNWLFIFVFRQGVAGAAISTLLSRLFTLGIMTWLLTDRKRDVWISLHERFRPRWNIAKAILYIGVPSGIESSLFNLGRLMVVAIIARFGTMEVAANAVANTIAGFGNMIGSSCGLAMITVIGQSVGTGSEATVRYYVRKMSIWSQIGYATWSLSVLLFIQVIIGFFQGLTPETRHLAVILAAIHCGFGALLWPCSFVLPNALRAVNDVRYAMWVSILSMGIVRIGLAWFCAVVFHIGAIGVWCAMVCDWIVRICFFVHRYRSNRWMAYATLK